MTIKISGKKNIFSLVFSLCFDDDDDNWIEVIDDINEHSTEFNPKDDFILKNIAEKLRIAWFKETFYIELTNKECKYILSLVCDLFLGAEKEIHSYCYHYAKTIALVYGKEPKFNRFFDLYKIRWLK